MQSCKIHWDKEDIKANNLKVQQVAEEKLLFCSNRTQFLEVIITAVRPGVIIEDAIEKVKGTDTRIGINITHTSNNKKSFKINNKKSSLGNDAGLSPSFAVSFGNGSSVGTTGMFPSQRAAMPQAAGQQQEQRVGINEKPDRKIQTDATSTKKMICDTKHRPTEGF